MEQKFFGPSPSEARAEAEKARSQFGDISTEYGAAMVALGNACMIHASPALGLDAYKAACEIFLAIGPETDACADAQERYASALRQLSKFHQAFEVLSAALLTRELTGTLSSQEMDNRREEVAELRKLSRANKTDMQPPADYR